MRVTSISISWTSALGGSCNRAYWSMNLGVKSLLSMAKEFTGLPMDSLIGSPLNADSRKKSAMALTQTKFMLEYPNSTATGQLERLEVAMSLITLTPLTMAQIEKKKFSDSFDLEIVAGELQLNFSNNQRSRFFRRKSKIGNLEITLTPQDALEGMRLIVEGYDAILKRQISQPSLRLFIPIDNTTRTAGIVFLTRWGRVESFTRAVEIAQKGGHACLNSISATWPIFTCYSDQITRIATNTLT